MRLLKGMVSVFTLLVFGVFSAALFAAIRVGNSEYLIIGLPIFIVIGSIHLIVSKRWRPFLVVLVFSSLFGFFLPFLFS